LRPPVRVALAALVEGMMMAITAIVTRVEWMDGSEDSDDGWIYKNGNNNTSPEQTPSKAACCRHVAIKSSIVPFGHARTRITWNQPNGKIHQWEV
jgi:hypothetical protein